jgi:5-methylcytosine-specific restriction protein A
MNGDSPTLWLRDDASPVVAEALWGWAGVRDLAKLPVNSISLDIGVSDSLDDLAGFDYTALGADGATRVQRMTSGVPRDPAVRLAVISRCGGACERAGCQAKNKSIDRSATSSQSSVPMNSRAASVRCQSIHRE